MFHVHDAMQKNQPHFDTCSHFPPDSPEIPYVPLIPINKAKFTSALCGKLKLPPAAIFKNPQEIRDLLQLNFICSSILYQIHFRRRRWQLRIYREYTNFSAGVGGSEILGRSKRDSTGKNPFLSFSFWISCFLFGPSGGPCSFLRVSVCSDFFFFQIS